VKLRWLLPSFVSLFLISLPAEAAKILYWRYTPAQNRLDFTTDEGIQPKAQLLLNPTRLIIDLPSTTLNRPTVTQTVGGAIKWLRVGQFDDQTTRLVLELNDGFTLDPQKIRVKGITPTQWTVELPPAQREDQFPTLPNPNPNPNPTPNPNFPNNRPNNQRSGDTILQQFLVRQEGFFIRTSGGLPELNIRRSLDRSTINLDIAGGVLSPDLPQELTINRYGVNKVEFSQKSSFPLVARLSLSVDGNSPDWQANYSSILGGILITPKNNNNSQNIPTVNPPPIANFPPPNLNPIARNPAPNTANTQIKSVDISSNGGMLVIKGDNAITGSKVWDSAERAYRVTIPGAAIAANFRGPQLNINSPISRIRLRQQEGNVLIFVHPANGTQLGDLSQLGDQLIALQIERSRTATTPLTLPNPVIEPPPVENPTIETPRPRNGRLLVMIDPGHGGKDSGAPGVGGILEKDVILPISQKLSAILEKAGIQTVLTRNSDYFVDLAPRVQMAQRMGATLFVSIHANSIDGRPDVSGLETYHYNIGESLARTVHNTILQSIPIQDRGVRRARFYVLRKNSMPAILVETGYVTNAEEIRKLNDPNYQQLMAQAIAQGVLKYIRANY
jgi:N-acetylmuramoyl-L-alanine amidase